MLPPPPKLTALAVRCGVGAALLQPLHSQTPTGFLPFLLLSRKETNQRWKTG